MEVMMKRELLFGLCVVSMGLSGMGQDPRGLDAPLLREVGVDVEAAESAVAAPGTPAHQAGSSSAAGSPEKILDGNDTFDAIYNSNEVQELFQREPALRALFDDQKQKIRQVIEELPSLNQEHKKNPELPRGKRIFASALELGISTAGMMLYSYFLDRGGYNTASIVQHYVAQIWLRNIADINPLGRLVTSLLAVGAAQGLDYHVAIPQLGNALGLAPLTLFIALGVIVSEVKNVNPISKTRETMRASAARFRRWIKSFRGHTQ